MPDLQWKKLKEIVDQSDNCLLYTSGQVPGGGRAFEREQ